MTIRPASPDDIAAIGALAETAGLFPAADLPAMIAPGLAGGPDTWLVTGPEAAATGFAFARPEELTDRVWNVCALATAPEVRNRGLARKLLTAMETALDARMIVIETTQLPEQVAARALYLAAGYSEEGRVRDYYAAGEDKVIFRKVVQ